MKKRVDKYRRFLKKALALSSLILLAQFGFSQYVIYVKVYFTDNFIFNDGYWVYRDTVNNETDSITLTGCYHGFIPPTPVINDYWEYYKMNFHSHSFNTDYNEYIVTYIWKRNGGGQYGELGQPLMLIEPNAQYPSVGSGFNGFEITAILDSIQIGDNLFYDVVVSRIYADQQYQHEFDYTTDLYFAPHVGIVRKSYTDSSNVNHCWDIVNWQINVNTATQNVPLPSKVSVFPNPGHTTITVYCEGMNQLYCYDLSGRLILQKRCNSDMAVIETSELFPGAYLLKVITGESAILRKVIIE